MSGAKLVLQERLRDHFLGNSLAPEDVAPSGFAAMTLPQLKETCIVRGLKKAGTKADLIQVSERSG